MENLSDAVLNAFSKLRDPDERFVQMKLTVNILDDHLRIVDKIGTRLLQHERGVSIKSSEAVLRYQELQNDSPDLAGIGADFSEALKTNSEELDRLTASQEMGLFSLVKEYISYCRNAKAC